MSVVWEGLCVDTADPDRIARFWAAALGWRRTTDETDEVHLEPPAGQPGTSAAPALAFVRVPDPKAVKNRLHLELRPDDQDAEVERLSQLGARRADVGQGSEASWIVLADPDGNEFCVMRPSAAAAGAD